MAGKKSAAGSEDPGVKERSGKAATTGEPTHCDICGKPLGVWFSLADKAYCSPCFHAHFWTPFQSAPQKGR